MKKKKKKKRLTKFDTYARLFFILVLCALSVFLGKVCWNAMNPAPTEDADLRPAAVKAGYFHSLVKIKDVSADRLERYNAYYRAGYGLSMEEAVEFVNWDVDILCPKGPDERVLELSQDKFFVGKNLSRYLALYDGNSQNVRAVVEKVNACRDNTAYEDIEPTDLSKGIMVLVNKYHYLDSSYIPDDLVNAASQYCQYSSAKLSRPAYEAFVKMATDAKAAGYTIKINSGYRSYSKQRGMYNNYVAGHGKAEADTFSARPGFSEHQTGLAIDLSSPGVGYWSFGDSAAGRWVHANAHKYGFILRYLEDKTDITGYIYECMHFRYVGVDAATFIYENGIAYEDYYEKYVK